MNITKKLDNKLLKNVDPLKNFFEESKIFVNT